MTSPSSPGSPSSSSTPPDPPLAGQPSGTHRDPAPPGPKADPLDLGGAGGAPLVAAEAALPAPAETVDPAEAAAAAGAAPLLRQLVAVDPADGPARETARQLVEALGREAQATAARRSRLLDAPLGTLGAGSGDDEVTEALDGLRSEVARLDPAGADLDQGPVGRLLGRLPGARSPVQRYFDRFEASQDQLDRILTALERGRDQLRRDIVTLGHDQAELADAARELAAAAALVSAVDRGLEAALADADGVPGRSPVSEPRRQFLTEDLRYAVRQRAVDLQQQLAVTQQGVLAFDVLLQNNRELARGVDRALNVTVAALDVAVTVALGVAHQRLVLDKVTAVTARAPEIVRDAERALRGDRDVAGRAGAGGADLAALRAAFADVGEALDEIARHREQPPSAQAGQTAQAGQQGPTEATDPLLDLDSPTTDRPTTRREPS